MRLGEAVLIRTHNIGFYEEISKSIPSLSKYHQISSSVLTSSFGVGLDMVNPVNQCQYGVTKNGIRSGSQ